MIYLMKSGILLHNTVHIMFLTCQMPVPSDGEEKLQLLAHTRTMSKYCK